MVIVLASQHGACIMMHRGQLYAQCTEFSIPPPGDGAAVIASILLQLVLCSGELCGCKATPSASEGLLTSQQMALPGLCARWKGSTCEQSSPAGAASSARCCTQLCSVQWRYPKQHRALCRHSSASAEVRSKRGPHYLRRQQLGGLDCTAQLSYVSITSRFKTSIISKEPAEGF